LCCGCGRCVHVVLHFLAQLMMCSIHVMLHCLSNSFMLSRAALEGRSVAMTVSQLYPSFHHHACDLESGWCRIQECMREGLSGSITVPCAATQTAAMLALHVSFAAVARLRALLRHRRCRAGSLTVTR
jgi:hypothetical protein